MGWFAGLDWSCLILFFSPALVRVEAGSSSLPAPRSCHLQTTPDKGVVGDDGDDGDDDGGDDNHVISHHSHLFPRPPLF